MNPFPHDRLRALATAHGTPLWVYDAATIRARIDELRAFDTIRYAQKANSNLHLLRLMRAEGVTVDAVSLGEIERALAAGYAADEIVFTADLFDAPTLARVVRDGIAVNAGSIDMLHQLAEAGRAAAAATSAGSGTDFGAGPAAGTGPAAGHPVWLRINPGFGHGHSRKTNTGGELSKHGIWHADLEAALAVVRGAGLRLVGLHMHIGSGVDYAHLERVAEAMVGLVERLGGTPIEAISAGGGLSVPYRAGEARIDAPRYHALWDAARRRIAGRLGRPVRLELEPGRYLVAEAGVLLAEVRATKTMGSKFYALVDAGFNELMRPSMYGAYHGIGLIPAAGDAARPTRETVVAGPLCESGDVFTQGEGGVVTTRELPEARVGDLLAFHDAGAYGASMSSNYNSRPLAAEVLVDGDVVRPIRRRQTMGELLALELGVGEKVPR